MKPQHSIIRYIASVAAMLACLSVTGLAHAQTTITYDFNSLSLGSISHQDSWAGSGYTPAIVKGATETNTTNIIENAGAGDSQWTRTFALPYAKTQTTAYFQADMQWQSGVGTGYARTLAGVGVKTDSTTTLAFNMGLYSGGSTQNFYIQVYNPNATNGYTTYTSPVPGTIADGDWLQLRAMIDFTANGGNGSVTLEYRDITEGSTSVWTAVMTKPLSLTTLANGADDPANWNAVWLRMTTGTGNAADAIAVDNLVMSNGLSTIPEPAMESVVLAGLAACIGAFFHCRKRRVFGVV